MFSTTIRVQVGDTDPRATRRTSPGTASTSPGGKTVSITSAIDQAQEFFRANRDETWKAVTFWVWMDDSGVAYHVEVNRRGHHTVIGAAPMPGPHNVREVYTA
jgi:hypothetical protein